MWVPLWRDYNAVIVFVPFQIVVWMRKATSSNMDHKAAYFQAKVGYNSNYQHTVMIKIHGRLLHVSFNLSTPPEPGEFWFFWPDSMHWHSSIISNSHFQLLSRMSSQRPRLKWHHCGNSWTNLNCPNHNQRSLHVFFGEQAHWSQLLKRAMLVTILFKSISLIKFLL